MKNLLRLIVLFVAVALFTVSCIPYGLEYRDVTFYNTTVGPVDISYRVLGERYSEARRVYGYDKFSVCTIYGKADISIEGPYASYLFTEYPLSADGTTKFYIYPNRGLIEVQNLTGGDIYDVSLGTITNQRRCGATFDLTNNVDTTNAYIAAGKSAGIRVPYNALTTTETGTYYIFFTKGFDRYISKTPVSIPKNGEKVQMKLSASDFIVIR